MLSKRHPHFPPQSRMNLDGDHTAIRPRAVYDPPMLFIDDDVKGLDRACVWTFLFLSLPLVLHRMTSLFPRLFPTYSPKLSRDRPTNCLIYAWIPSSLRDNGPRSTSVRLYERDLRATSASLRRTDPSDSGTFVVVDDVEGSKGVYGPTLSSSFLTYLSYSSSPFLSHAKN